MYVNSWGQQREALVYMTGPAIRDKLSKLLRGSQFQIQIFMSQLLMEELRRKWGNKNIKPHSILRRGSHFKVVQFSSVTQSSATLCNPIDRSTPGLLVQCQPPVPTQTHVHWVGGAIQPSHPLWSPSPPTFNLSQHQGLFQWVSSSHEVAKVLEFQLQHPSNEYSGLISFRMGCLDLLTVQGSLKSLLQHHSSKPLILRCSAFFVVQLSGPYWKSYSLD